MIEIEKKYIFICMCIYVFTYLYACICKGCERYRGEMNSPGAAERQGARNASAISVYEQRPRYFCDLINGRVTLTWLFDQA